MPNALLIMSDEHNPRYSSPYGHPLVQTPNLQALADRGTVYEAAYCPSPLCLPSRSAFISGQRVHRIQTYSNCNHGLDPSPPTYGAVLAGQGVHAAYVGKTDVYAPGAELGFCDMILPGDRRPPGDTNHRRNPLAIRHGAAQRASGYGPRADGCRGDEERTAAALEWIRSRAATLDRPWVLAVNLTKPHFPHYAPPELWDLYPDGEDLPDCGPEAASAGHPYARALRAHFETEGFAEADVRGLRRGYLACVSFVDRQVGRLVEALAAVGVLDDTDVIYTSDHGEMLGKFGMWWKCSLYEDSARVPVIAAGPSFPPGARVATAVDLHDVQAALFHSTGVRRPPEWTGQALQELGLDDGERVVFGEYHGHGTPGSSCMVRRGRWKYLHYVDAPPQLFDLSSDPEELEDLAAVRPEVAAELVQHLERICAPDVENRRAEDFIETQLAALGVE